MTPQAPIGWPLLPRPDASGQIAWPTLEKSIDQLIRVILQTRPGEQLMRPAWGAGLEDFIHEPNTPATHRRLRDSILDALGSWESRIQVDDVAVSTLPNDPGRVRIEIAYRIRRTGAARRTGLTLDLAA
jgi:phage baseplate assembly protein W